MPLPKELRTQKWIAATALAESIGVSRMTVNRWCRDGKLPCKREGRLWLVDAHTLDSAPIIAGLLPTSTGRKDPRAANWLSASDWADAVGVTRQAATDFCRRGLIPAERVGRLWRVDMTAYRAKETEAARGRGATKPTGRERAPAVVELAKRRAHEAEQQASEAALAKSREPSENDRATAAWILRAEARGERLSKQQREPFERLGLLPPLTRRRGSS